MIDFEDLKGKIGGPTVLIQAPFKGNYDLNIEALRRNIQFVIDGGIGNDKGIIICPCGSGEYVTLSPEEHKMMVKTAVEVAGDRLLVVAGVQSCDFRQAVRSAHAAAEVGAECVMIPAPYYYRLSQEDVYRWYKLLAEAIPVGIMTYNQPRRNLGTRLSVQLMGKLADTENIVSMKYGGEASEDYIRALDLYSKRFPFIDNSHGYASTVAHMHGAAGYITGPGAFWPEFEAEYWSLLEQHKYAEADKWHAKQEPLWKFCGGDQLTGGGSSVFKAAQEYVGLYGGPVRPPFIDLTKERKEELFGILRDMGVKPG